MENCSSVDQVFTLRKVINKMLEEQKVYMQLLWNRKKLGRVYRNGLGNLLNIFGLGRWDERP